MIKVPEYEFDVLPAGLHEASMEEIEAAFVFNTRRRVLFDRLLRATQELWRAGCLRVYVDGSFVTSKPLPGDFDACYETMGVNISLLNPVFLDFRDGCTAQKQVFGGEFFPTHGITDAGGRANLEFFQRIRGTAARKGIVTVALRTVQ